MRGSCLRKWLNKSDTSAAALPGHVVAQDGGTGGTRGVEGAAVDEGGRLGGRTGWMEMSAPWQPPPPPRSRSPLQLISGSVNRDGWKTPPERFS